MNEENELTYFKGGLALGVGLGLVGGIASTLFYHKKKTISADLVLENVKAAFLKEGPIEGSWIEFEKSPCGNSPSTPKHILEEFAALKTTALFNTNSLQMPTQELSLTSND